MFIKCRKIIKYYLWCLAELEYFNFNSNLLIKEYVILSID
jgi:hypothetical protein